MAPQGHAFAGEFAFAGAFEWFAVEAYADAVAVAADDVRLGDERRPAGIGEPVPPRSGRHAYDDLAARWIGDRGEVDAGHRAERAADRQGLTGAQGGGPEPGQQVGRA